MKYKFLKILLLFIVILLAGLYVFRHAILSHAFKISISEKTNKTVELQIGHLYYDMLGSTITFKDSRFKYHNIYVDKKQSIVLSDFKFAELTVEHLSVYKLIFHREFIADKISLVEPSFWFSQKDKKQQFQEKPKEVIKGLKENPKILGNLVVIVNEIIISKGHVDLTSIVGSGKEKSYVEYTLMLKDFNTQKENIFDENSFLFSNKHLLKLTNFDYHFPNGDSISFDSLILGSVNNRLAISNIRAHIVDTSDAAAIKSIDADISEIAFSGINLTNLQRFKDIYIDSLEINKSNILIIGNETSKPKQSKNGKSSRIKKMVESLKLGRFKINDANVFAGRGINDTTVSIHSLNFKIDSLVFDSNMIENKIPKFDTSSVNLAIQKFKLDDMLKGFKVSFNNLDLNESKEHLVIENVSIDDKVEGEHSYMIRADTFDIYGVSFNNSLKPDKMKLGIEVSNPVINIDVEQLKKKNTNGTTVEVPGLILDEIYINNGMIHILEKDKLGLDISGLNMNWNDINLSSPKEIHNLNTDNLDIDFMLLNMELMQHGIYLKTGSSSITNNSVRINDMSSNIDKGYNNISFKAKDLNIDGSDIKKMLSDNKLIIDNLKLNKPVVAGTIGEAKSKKDKTSGKSDNKLAFDIRNISIIDGEVDMTIKDSVDYTISSNLDIYLNNILTDDISNLNWVADMKWKLNLQNLSMTDNVHEIKVNELNSISKDSSVTISNLAISQNNKQSQHLKINDIRVGSIGIKGIDVTSILNKEKPSIYSATISNPFVDIIIDNRIKQEKKKANNQNKLPVDLKLFELENMKISLQQIDSNAASMVDAHSINLKLGFGESENIVDDLLELDIANVDFNNPGKGFDFSMADVNFNKAKSELGLRNLVLNSEKDSLNKTNLTIEDILFDGLHITKTMPFKVTLDSLYVDGVDARISSEKKLKSKTKSSNIAISLPNDLKGLEVDYLEVNPASFYHISHTDSSQKISEYDGIKLDITKIKIDSSVLANDIFNFAQSIKLNIREKSFISKDSLYASNIKSIEYRPMEEKIIIDSAKMLARYADEEFFKRAVYQTGRMNVQTDSIVCGNFNIHTLLDNDKLHIGSIDVYGLDAHIYRNKTYDMDPNAYKKLPQEALLSLKQKILIDSVKTHDSYIHYKEFEKKSVVPGELYLDRFNLTLYNINNDISVLDNTSSMVASLHARFMGKANLFINVTFPILSPANDFWVKGHIENIDFPDLNNLTENLAGITMASGTGKLDIPLISGNSQNSSGMIYFSYKKLKIDLYSREKAQSTKGLTGSMANLLLNDIFIKSNNPGWLGKTRPGEVYFKRNPQKSVVNYIWKSIQSGLMSTMGYNNKEQRQEKRAWQKRNKALTK